MTNITVDKTKRTKRDVLGPQPASFRQHSMPARQHRNMKYANRNTTPPKRTREPAHFSHDGRTVVRIVIRGMTELVRAYQEKRATACTRMNLNQIRRIPLESAHGCRGRSHNQFEHESFFYEVIILRHFCPTAQAHTNHSDKSCGVITLHCWAETMGMAPAWPWL